MVPSLWFIGAAFLLSDCEERTSHSRPKALARRARLDPSPAAGRAPADSGRAYLTESLTDRERDVLRLLSRGQSNRQIGAELFISPKTASVHVSNILAKLAVTNRTEAAAVAHREGL